MRTKDLGTLAVFMLRFDKNGRPVRNVIKQNDLVAIGG